MAKKNKSKGKKSFKKNPTTDTNKLHPSSEEYIFDEETLALAGGDVELLHDIRRMIVGMDDNSLKKCVENLKTGEIPAESIWDMIMDSNKNKSLDTNGGGNKNDELPMGTDTHDERKTEMLETKFGEEPSHESEEFEGKEFSIDLELPNSFFNPYKLHDALFKVLRICTFDTFDDRIYDLFTGLAVLCDPYTQPCDSGENNEMILSADLVSDLIIGIMYEEYIEIDESLGNVKNVPYFEMAYDLAKIVEKICMVLNMDDENTLMYVKNDTQNWESELHKWLPQDTFSNMTNIASDYHHMMLLYTIVTVALLTINKLYGSSGNICLNPFLSLYLQLWKNFSKVILLGIEIDCRDEENGFPGYPEVIRYVIKGSSAVRSMISLILNDEFERRVHDLKHESLINFMRPWGRKFSNGSIKVDMRVFVAALLALGSELDSVTELLFGFVPEDRYDEDVKYMFEMELEDMNCGEEDGDAINRNEKVEDLGDGRKRYIGDNVVVEIEREDEDEDEDENEENEGKDKDEFSEGKLEDGRERKKGNYMAEKAMESTIYDLHPDCQCEFEDFESDVEYEEEDDEDEEEDAVNDGDIELINELGEIAAGEGLEDTLSLDILRNINNGPSALRYQQPKNVKESYDTMIDSKGRDWRDIPRGKNNILSDNFVKLLKDSVENSKIFITGMNDLILEMKKMSEKQVNEELSEKVARSVAWVVQYERESMMMNDEERKGSDDSINADVIYNFLKKDDRFIDMVRFNYNGTFGIMDELLMAEGYRRVLIWFLSHLPLNQWIINYIHELLIGKRGENCKGYEFSRVGNIELSEVERTMLLHEFFSNAVIFLSQSDQTRDRIEAEKIVKIICLMLKSLEINGILDPESDSSDEYRVEIQTLLFQWVGITAIPEARELFFKYGKRVKMVMNENKVSNEAEIEGIINKVNVHGNSKMETRYEEDLGFSEINKTEIVMHNNNKMQNIFHALNNFDVTTVFMISLNLAAQIGEKLTDPKCFKFLQDLNSLTGIYKNNEDLENDCSNFFTELHKELIKKDVKGIIRIARKFGILFDEDDKKATEVAQSFIRERYT